MNNRLILILAAAALPGFHGGCGNPPGHYPVHGTVLFKGEPAAGAVVYFHPEGPAAALAPTIPFAITEDDGRFHVVCDSRGNGCPPGKYAVLVEWRDGSGDGVVPVKSRGKASLVKRSRVRSGPDKLGGRYLNLTKPLLHVEVLPQSNSLSPFELGG
jgi:hypothetical protein